MPGAPRNASRYLASGAAIVALSFVTLAAWRGLDAADPASVASNSSTQQSQQAPVTAVAPATANGLVTSYAPIVKSVTPGVVTVRVEAKAAPTPTGGQMPDLGELFGRQFRMVPQQPHRERGLGSGVVIKGDGYILTNNHVVDGAEDIKVELPDKRVFNAKLIGADPATDLAVIKVDAANLRTVPLGDSDKVQVGDVVLAVGNPLGIGQTVTMGIVSGKGRTTGGYGDGGFEDFLQTDAPINRGNSGGALVNVQGQLIGINSQILSPSGGSIGLGFAIPVNMARNVMDQLLVDGKVHRAKLGVALQGMTADLAASLGLPDVKGGLVSSVEPNSAAERAGLKQGDVLLDVDGRGVADANELRNAIASTKPGTTVNLKVLRDGREQTIRATLGELPSKKDVADARGDDAEGGKFGMTVEPLTPDTARRLDLPRTTTGVVVTDLDPDGQAAAGGVQEGDVIEKVNGKSVASVSELRAALNAASQKPALVLVNRQGAGLFLTLRAARG